MGYDGASHVTNKIWKNLDDFRFSDRFFFWMSFISSSTFLDAKKWPLNTNKQQVTTNMHSCFWMFSLNEQHQALDRFYSTRFLSLPWSIKCITRMSGSNLDTSSSTRSVSCSAWTDLRLFLSLMPSVLCCGSAILSWGLTTVSHFSWERSVYFLSLLNLWKKRASPLSCLPTSGIMLCNRIGPVGWVKRGKKKNHPGKDLKNTFRSIMLRHFPCLYRTCFIPSPRGMTIFGHSVSPVCLQDKEVFKHTSLSASSSAQPAGQYKNISHIFIM